MKLNKYLSPEKIREMKSIFYDSEYVPECFVENHYNLVVDIFGKANLSTNCIILKELKECISSLNEKWKNCIVLKYGLEDGISRSLSETGAILNIKGERVRQIVNHAFFNLISCKYKFHVHYRIASLELKKQAIEKEIEELTININNPKPVNITVNDFNFSVRAYNALRHNSINTYDELMKLTVRELKSIRNIGSKTADEIWFRLHGVHI